MVFGNKKSSLYKCYATSILYIIHVRSREREELGWERGVGDRQVSAKGKGEVKSSKVNSM